MCCPPGAQLTTVASPLSGPRRVEAGSWPLPLPWDSHQLGSKGGGRAGSGHGVPPLKGKRFPPHVGATVDLSEQLVVKEKVVDKDAAQTQRLQQGAHLLLQAAATIDDGPEGLGDAQVLAQDQHIHLWEGGVGSEAGPQHRLPTLEAPGESGIIFRQL